MKINIEIDNHELGLVSQLNNKKALNNPHNTKRIKEELLGRIIHKINNILQSK